MNKYRYIYLESNFPETSIPDHLSKDEDLWFEKFLSAREILKMGNRVNICTSVVHYFLIVFTEPQLQFKPKSLAD